MTKDSEVAIAVLERLIESLQEKPSIAKGVIEAILPIIDPVVATNVFELARNNGEDALREFLTGCTVAQVRAVIKRNAIGKPYGRVNKCALIESVVSSVMSTIFLANDEDESAIIVHVPEEDKELENQEKQ